MRSCEAAVFLVTLVANIAPPSSHVPYQVSLRHSVRSAHVCSGVILSPDWILTTARCVYSFHGSGITAAYGSQSQSYINEIFGQTYTSNDIDMVVIHPKFNKKTFQNDVAMLLTKSKIQFQPNVVSSILLPSKPVREGDSVSVYGLNFDKVSLSIWFLAIFSTILSSFLAYIVSWFRIGNLFFHFSTFDYENHSVIDKIIFILTIYSGYFACWS